MDEREIQYHLYYRSADRIRAAERQRLINDVLERKRRERRETRQRILRMLVERLTHLFGVIRARPENPSQQALRPRLPNVKNLSEL
jgi:hypothetical protein